MLLLCGLVYCIVFVINRCTSSYLISGDENGELILWRLLREVGEGQGRATPPQLSVMCKWNVSFGLEDPQQSICAIYEISWHSILVLQAGKVPGSSFLWQVSLAQRASCTASIEELLRLARQYPDGNIPDSAALSPSKQRPRGKPAAGAKADTRADAKGGPGANAGAKSDKASIGFQDDLDDPSESEAVTIYKTMHPDIHIAVKHRDSFVHESLETSCTEINVSSMDQRSLSPSAGGAGATAAASAKSHPGASQGAFPSLDLYADSYAVSEMGALPAAAADEYVVREMSHETYAVLAYIGTTTGKILRYETAVST